LIDITFLLGGIVLSNGYTGVLIPEIVKPIRQLGLATVAEAIDTNYTSKFLANDAWTVTKKFDYMYRGDFCSLSDQFSNAGYDLLYKISNANFTSIRWGYDYSH